VSLLKKAGSTVVQYFEWDLPKVLSQGRAELLKYADNRRFSSEPDVVRLGFYSNTPIAGKFFFGNFFFLCLVSPFFGYPNFFPNKITEPPNSPIAR
jgi:hypothetical protein